MNPKKLGLLGPDKAMLLRPAASLPTLDYTTLAYSYLDMQNPIENQDVTSACYAYSTSSIFESYSWRRRREKLVISKRAAVSITNARVNPGNTQDQGGYPSDVVTTLEGGYVLETDWPDDASDDSVQMDPVPSSLVKTDFVAEGIVSVPTSLEGVVLAGHAHGPVAICVGWPIELYTDDVLDSDGLAVQLTDPSNIVGYHAIVVVAHEPAGGLFGGAPEVCLIRNSWGSSWGGGRAPGGYIWIRASDVASILTEGNCCMEVAV